MERDVSPTTRRETSPPTRRPARAVRDTAARRQAGRTRYEYDGQGRLTKAVRRTLSGTEKVSEYVYDAFDRLIEANTPDNGRWRYRYDPLGRRVAKQRLGADGAPVEDYRFCWDGTTLAEQRHEAVGRAEVAVTSWDYEPGSFTPIVQVSRTHLADASAAGDRPPLPRDRDRPRRHPDRAGHPGRHGRVAPSRGPVGRARARAGREPSGLPAALPRPVSRRGNRPRLQLRALLRPEHRPVHHARPARSRSRRPTTTATSRTRSRTSTLWACGTSSPTRGGSILRQVAARHGGVELPDSSHGIGNFMFPNRRAARGAASEVAGDLGRTRALSGRRATAARRAAPTRTR